MASFFRKRVAQKVISVLLKNKQLNQLKSRKDVLLSMVKISRSNRKDPQLALNWENLKRCLPEVEVSSDPAKLVTLMRNEGLPTAEGFIDIELSSDPPHLLFTVDKHVFSKIVLMDICINEEALAKSSCLFQHIPHKSIVVYCSSPALGSIFNASHFRSAIHAKFVATINKFVGHDSTLVTHVDDWSLVNASLVMGYQNFGSHEELLRNPSEHLAEVMKAVLIQCNNEPNFKDKIMECYEKMQKGNDETLALWSKLKDICMKQYQSIYERLGIHFDNIHFDSSYPKEIQKISDQLIQMPLVVIEKDGTMKLNFSQETDKSLPMRNQFESPVSYIARQIFAVIHHNEKYGCNDMYIMAPSFQKSSYLCMFALIQKLNSSPLCKLHHLKLKNISDLNPKKGRNLSVLDLLQRSKIGMLKTLKNDLHLESNEEAEHIAEVLSLSSLCILDMKHRRNVDYDFNWTDTLQFGKDTATSFQFLHAGLLGLQEDSKINFKVDIDTSPLSEPEAQHLIQHLARFDEMVYKSYTSLEPCIIFQYLSTLWYLADKTTNILKVDHKTELTRAIKARLLLFSATQKVLQTGLKLLGIKPLEKI